MYSIKRKAFTLSEALITLAIVGVLATLVIPGLLRDTTNKALIAQIQGTVTTLNDSIQNELVKTRAIKITDTDIAKDPVKYLKTLDTVSVSNNSSAFANKYKTLNGGEREVDSMSASAVLKNGVSIGILPDTSNPYSKVYIDANGKKEPNIHGVDYFVLSLIDKNDKTTGDHAGDIGCRTAAIETNISDCKSGGGMACFCALERSGFNHNYLK